MKILLALPILLLLVGCTTLTKYDKTVVEFHDNGEIKSETKIKYTKDGYDPQWSPNKDISFNANVVGGI